MPARRPRPWCDARLMLLVALVAASNASEAAAHEGPPFPLVVDQRVAGYKVDVWADPDIGDAQFFVIIEDEDGGMPSTVPEVSFWTQPVSERLPKASYEASQQDLRNRLQFEVRPYFDRRDMWTVGVQLTTPSGHEEELTLEVESTPPGYGAWDLLIYLFPFALLSAFWMFAIIRRRTRWRSAAAPTDTAQGAHRTAPKQMATETQENA